MTRKKKGIVGVKLDTCIADEVIIDEVIIDEDNIGATGRIWHPPQMTKVAKAVEYVTRIKGFDHTKYAQIEQEKANGTNSIA